MTNENKNINSILMTADTVGGVWSYCMSLIKEFSKYDIEVHLATMGDKLSEDQWKQSNDLHNLTIYESEYKLEWMQDPWKDVDEAGEWLLQLEADINPDLIHLNNYCHGSLNWEAPVLMVCHSCVFSWWRSVKNALPGSDWNIYRQRLSDGLTGADSVIGITEWLLDQMTQIYGFRTPSRVIYNGADPSNYQNKEKQPFIFAMGRIWDEAKNLEVLNDTVPAVEWPVMVAGNQEHPENGSSKELKNVMLPGWLNQTEIRNRLSEAAIFALPAKYEPFGLSALEAALSGCTLLLADIPTLREVWGNAAIYASPDNEDEWIQKINFLIKNPDIRKKWGRRGFHKAQKFNIETTGQKYLKVYEFLQNRRTIPLKTETII